MAQPKPRREYKHFINPAEAAALRQRLRAVMQRDCHAGPDGTYRIRSLYFDNYADKALQEKLDGVNQREKFRLRYYNDETGWIKLERKARNCGLCQKYEASVSRGECERLLAGDTSWMAGRPEPVVSDLYAKMQSQLLRPRTLVEYTREPYVFLPGNVRITLDSNIRSGLYSLDFFNPDLPTLSAGPPGQIVLEVKFDEFLPDIIADIIQVENRQSASMSKYAACRIYG